jgi:hypothetical protein
VCASCDRGDSGYQAPVSRCGASQSCGPLLVPILAQKGYDESLEALEVVFGELEMWTQTTLMLVAPRSAPVRAWGCMG